MTLDLTRRLIQTHLERYPHSQIADVYKLLHQATFGSSHAVSKKKNLQEWLEHEFEVNPPRREETLVESISLTGDWVRLHLRPYLAYGGQLKPMQEAIVTSAQTNGGTLDQMAERWGNFESMVEGALSQAFFLRDVRLFGRVAAERQWAVCPHSPEFIAVYNPAYFILTLSDARQVCEKQNIPFNV